MKSTWIRWTPQMVFSVLALLVGISPRSLDAQVLAGRILDAVTGSPVGDADVVVVSRDGEIMLRRLSNSHGHFAVHLDGPGIFLVTINRIGYATGDSVSVVVPPDQTLFLELEVDPQGVELPGITVTGTRQSSWLHRRGFFQRQKTGVGTFLEADAIQRSGASRIEDVLRRIPGAVVRSGVPYFMRYMGGLRGNCAPTILLDGMVVDPDILKSSIPVNWVVGIEAYKNSAYIPPQWRHFEGCGLVAIWTGF